MSVKRVDVILIVDVLNQWLYGQTCLSLHCNRVQSQLISKINQYCLFALSWYIYQDLRRVLSQLIVPVVWVMFYPETKNILQFLIHAVLRGSANELWHLILFDDEKLGFFLDTLPADCIIHIVHICFCLQIENAYILPPFV